ncbi:MAG: LssY C-terminal domain-containing protein [Candidatus Sulfomarinibacteraceae bacterium]
MRTGRPVVVSISALVFAVAAGCASFSPTPMEQVGFTERAETQTKGDITVTVAVLSADEARAVFDTKLYKKKIQPIWVEITNGTDEFLGFLPRSVDADYHSPLEVAQKSLTTGAKKSNRAKRLFYLEHQMPFQLPPGETTSGFVFGNRSLGLRWMALRIIGENWSEKFEFIVQIPGFKADFHKLEDVQTYAEDDYTDLDEAGLLEWIEAQPAFVTNKDGSKTGDPLNLVIIGTPDAVWPAFLSQGWGPTAAMTTGSALKTGIFGIFGGEYRYAPISDLYVYGRSQDIALQKVRNNIHYRNHLRLWEAPVRYQGRSVLIGQISRDIGSRLTTKSSTLTTHRIDPDVDETRASLIQDFLWAQALEIFGFAGGVGEISLDNPRGNLTGDIFFTDGQRAVMLLSEDPVDYEHIGRFSWHRPVSDGSAAGGADAPGEQ